ncbi:glycosyltransferase family 39 protein [Rubripirellula reticaptiva]|uniref:Tetratricopeptide repeat protein n=1 Tax=Rubripirellula reticaptiva TaxID=2528013 RepID=A0A5C6F4Z8_9BACT|nr:glycosyltransferase family 39 protein [Rubripirellula reticaptiva]TWU56122.1 Tetratricopeptide repeat protein [Rubripirellula reticaptiva]
MTKRNRHRTKTSPDTKSNSGEDEHPSGGHSLHSEQLIGFSFSVWMLGVAAVALTLRLMNVWHTANVPSIVQLLGDAAGYFEWGSRIAAGNWYGNETFYQAPLYPYFIAVLIKIFGVGVPGLRLVQAILGTIGAVAIGVTGKQWFGNRVGILAGLMMAMYAPAIYYDGIVQKASLASFLLCVLLATCSLFRSKVQSPAVDTRASAALAMATGVLIGLLVLTRENAMLWLPIFPLWIGILAFAKSKQFATAMVAFYFVGAAIVLVPVAARNASLGGEWSPTTFQAGPNFYIGNRAGASGIYEALVPGHETPVYERTDAQRIAEQTKGHPLTSREVSRFWFAQSYDEISRSPGSWVQLMIQKTFMVVNRFEVPDVDSLNIFQSYSIGLAVLSFWNFGTLVPLATLGIVATRRRWRELWFFDTLILIMVAAVALFFILGRYRLPLVPLLIPFAAAGITSVITAVADRKWSQLFLPAAAAVVMGALANLPVHDEAGLNASSLMNVGVAAGQHGDLPTAITLLERAVSLAPQIAESQFNLGFAWSMAGRPDRAVGFLENAVRLEPNFATANFYLAQNLERIGQPQRAIVFYKQTLLLEPNNRSAMDAIERLTPE